jgi:hypothetical protein
MNIYSLLLLFCGFIIGTTAGSGLAAIRAKRRLGRLKSAFVRQLTAVGSRCATANESDHGRIRITEAPEVIDYGAILRRFRATNRAAAVPVFGDRGRPNVCMPPVVTNETSQRPSAPCLLCTYGGTPRLLDVPSDRAPKALLEIDDRLVAKSASCQSDVRIGMLDIAGALG